MGSGIKLETLKKRTKQILELKISIYKMKNALENIGSKPDHLEERTQRIL